MWSLGSEEGERKGSDFILNWGSWEIFLPPFPWLGRKGEHSRGAERERQGQSSSQTAGTREGRGRAAERVGPKGTFCSILADNGTCHAGQLERWLIS